MTFNFGNTGATSGGSGFSFGQTSTATTTKPGFSFGPATTTASTGLFGGTKGFSGFGTAQTTSSASTNFGGSLFSTSKTAPGGLFGATSAVTNATTTATGGLFTTPAQQQTKPFVGLGGTDISTSSGNSNGGNTTVSTASQALKDQILPQEICKNVVDFEQYVKRQKEESAEVAKFSPQSLFKLREEMTTLTNSLGTVTSALQRNTAAVLKLKNEFCKQLQFAEMAQRTQDIPPALQHDNIAPVKYFMDMVVEFETNIQLYRQQIEQLENHLSKIDQPNTMTIKDISMALCKIQESFISIGSNLYVAHTSVQTLKEQYLMYRRIVFGDTTDVFSAIKLKDNLPKVQSGPSPFGTLGNVAALAIASVVNQQQPKQQQPVNTGFGQTGGLFGNTATTSTTGGLFGSNANKFGTTGFSGFNSGNKSAGVLGTGGSTTTGGLFGSGSTFNTAAGTTFGGTSTPFQLNKPPVGSKRGKK